LITSAACDRCHGATVPLGMGKAQEPEAAAGS
jgi:hypothetical protein